MDRPGFPIIDIVFKDIEKDTLCKMWNYHDLAGWGRIFYVYIANMVLNDQTISARISVEDFGVLGILNANQNPTQQYVLKEVNSSITTVLSSPGDSANTSLENYEVHYYCISPLVNGIALLGLSEIINGTKGITSTEWIDDRTLIITPGYAGTLLIYAENPEKVQVFDISNSAVPIEVDSANANILKLPVGKNPIRISY